MSLIHFLRDQGKPKDEWLDVISADQTISEAVRQRALQFAREWKSLLCRSGVLEGEKVEGEKVEGTFDSGIPLPRDESQVTSIAFASCC